MPRDDPSEGPYELLGDTTERRLRDDLKELLDVANAVKNGNFTARVPIDRLGIAGKIGDTLNDIAAANQQMSEQLHQIGQSVGRRGKTRHRIKLASANGAWGGMEASVNYLIDDLLFPINEVTRVIAAVAEGDLQQAVRLELDGHPLEGEFLRSAKIVNTMVRQLAVFTSEVTRVAREVGTEGKLGGQAEVRDVTGVWKDLTDSVNYMASNLTAQVRNISEVTIAVASGDLSKKITADVRGEILQLKEAINTMVDQLRSFASEVTRVAREVGTDGRLGGQAVVPGVGGTWKDLTDSVNAMCGNLTDQVRNIAQVTTAVARGDLSRKITVAVHGEILELKDTINTMVDQLNAFASEVTRVAREVGTEGKLGGQAMVPGVAGTWKDLTDSVNSMAGNLTAQVRNIADVATAIAGGDLSKKITVNVSGEILQLKETMNTMVDQLNAFAREVTRVAREVGTEGRLGGQANVLGVAGTWRDLTDSVNSMASNLTAQVRNIATVSTAIANGDLSKKITVDVKGEILELKDTINTMVDQLNAFASEVTRVAREVGTEGKLGGQATVRGVAGTWKDLTDSVNSMASNLTGQVRNIAEVATAVAAGDLSKKITVDVSGEILLLKDTINTMVDQLNAFAAEVTRVAREVGTEGRLGGQAEVHGVAGTWKDLTDSVNSMAGNLTGQVRNIAEVATAIANGDLSRKITVDVRGEILQLKETLNTMVDQLNRFAGEVTRVAREVGTEGRLGGQAQVPGVAGTWKDLTESVNSMANNLTAQVRNIAEVTTAVARGDLSRKITVDVKGEILELKNTINTMVDQLNGFASEVTRVAREVGTEGKLGGQAQVPGAGGTWKDLTDNVNFMASNLTAQVRNIADVATAIARGDLTQKITVDVRGELLLLKETLNTTTDQLRSFAAEVTRVAREVGTEGRLGGQAVVPGVAGTWKDLTDNVNLLAANLTMQVRNIAEVTTAVARGDLSRKITVDVKGEVLELKVTINTMVDQLNSFASEVTRVAREVGTEGKLGGQAQVPGVAGTWKDLTDTVNVMAANLTEQVRGIVRVVTAVADGDLKQSLTVQSKGEVAALAETINNMTNTLAIFADQVTSVAREVGVEGRLGGQANVPGAAGTWKDLTGNVNLLAANLTTQVRAIAEVATAVTKGDLTRSIQVDARGEVAELKDNINTMIGNLRLTTDTNREQDWLKTNLAKFMNMLQGQRDLASVGRLLLSELAPLVNADQGVIYQIDTEDETTLRLLAAYADTPENGHPLKLRLGQGLVGQCALDKRLLLVRDLPENVIPIRSALTASFPRALVVLPVLFKDQVTAVIELASLQPFTDLQTTFLDQLASSIGIVLNNIGASMETERLLVQSQNLAGELQAQQAELQTTNDQLEQKAQQLAERNIEVERKNQEIEEARRAVEDKANELVLTSKYKSEFLANMSHELRTPLNSILILGQQLSENPDGNLTDKQVEFARTIHGAGTDLLNLITDILDLSKIESRTVSVYAEDVPFQNLADHMARLFRHEADYRKLSFIVEIDQHLGPSITTDSTRLQQILKNLLSNAFKFTERGSVKLTMRRVRDGWSSGQPALLQAPYAVAFEVSDSGIGIPQEKQKLVFEAFQQADASTSRRFGGTGLGLAISRELAALLGGEIQLRSTPNVGSTFTLYLPPRYSGSTVIPADHGTDSQFTPRPELGNHIVLDSVADDRLVIQPGDDVLLIIDDDPDFARILAEVAHDGGLKILTAATGAESLELARERHVSAISLDIFLPDMLGWTILSILKQDPALMHIPVLIMSVEQDRKHGLVSGAHTYVSKPASISEVKAAVSRIHRFSVRLPRKLLLVESIEAEQIELQKLLANSDIEIFVASSGFAALEALASEEYDCIILDISLPDMTGLELIERLARNVKTAELPIVMFCWREMTPEERNALNIVERTAVVRPVGSPDALLATSALFLHMKVASLSARQRDMLLRDTQGWLAGSTALLVDDDIRNVFALSSVLERFGMKVLFASTGAEAIETLSRCKDVDIVLMDIMMPEMDGYDTIASIRRDLGLSTLPIIALTAKAMKGDREKCLEAGASDYLAKPVDTDLLMSALRIWIRR
jgi:HAMP domain-containing protein/signal transduction histidine kinase/DNA-binding response OmpR family regulator